MSLADPQLLTVLNHCAGWGRSKQYDLDPAEFATATFGNIPLQILLGDFMQLNPVLSHSLLETYLQGTDLVVPRVPTYEKMSPEARQRNQDLDQQGFRIFDIMSQNVILFRGCYRFKPCLLYTSPSPRDGLLSRMPSSA